MAKQIKQPVYEDQAEGSGAPLLKVLSAIACFGLAVLIIYIAVAPPRPETNMGAIRDVLRGLCGSMSLLLALVMVWIGILLIFSAQGKKLRIINIIANSILFLCAFTAVQLFAAPRVSGTMKLTEFFNFVSKSYRYGGGGGAIGSLLTWPLYNALSQWGGLIVVLLIALLCLVVTGRAQKFYRWAMQRAEEGQHHMDQRRKQKDAERLFDYNSGDYDEYDGYAPPQRRPRPNPAAQPGMRRPSRPDRDYMIIETPAPAAKPARKAASGTGSAPSSRKLYKETIDPETIVEEKKQHGMDIPRPMREIRRDHPDGITEELPEKKPRRSRSKFPRDIPDFFNVEEESKIEDIPDAEPEAEEFIPRRSSGKKPRRVVEGVQPLTVDGIVSEQESEEEDEAPFDIPHAGEKKAPVFSRRQAEAKEESYPYPPMNLLKQGKHSAYDLKKKETDQKIAEKLISVLRDYKIEAKLVGISHGPTVTRFEILPAPGIKISSISSLTTDIGMHMATGSARVEESIPGKTAIGIELPNPEREMVYLRDLLESQEAQQNKSKLAVALGLDNGGRYIIADIEKMPHLLIAGETGSGKSVCINSIITSILYRATPQEVRMILVDPKVVELSVYKGIPHLISPVVSEPDQTRGVLNWAVAEMESRYKLLEKKDVRNIKGYNQHLEPDEDPMPRILIVIDEFADMMDSSTSSEKREIENNVKRLTQKARAAGIHLILATQRPSVDVITGVIKGNIPTRIALSVSSQVDSRTILDKGGAEKLLGNGDMLFVPPGTKTPQRIQNPFISDEEVVKIVSYITSRCSAAYDETVIEAIEKSSLSDAEKEEKMQRKQESDPLLSEAIEYVIDAGQASTSSIQRHFRVGYSRAGSIMDQMEQRGIVSEANGSKPRNVLITREKFYEMFFPDEE